MVLRSDSQSARMSGATATASKSGKSAGRYTGVHCTLSDNDQHSYTLSNVRACRAVARSLLKH